MLITIKIWITGRQMWMFTILLYCLTWQKRKIVGFLSVFSQIVLQFTIFPPISKLKCLKFLSFELFGEYLTLFMRTQSNWFLTIALNPHVFNRLRKRWTFPPQNWLFEKSAFLGQIFPDTVIFHKSCSKNRHFSSYSNRSDFKIYKNNAKIPTF